MALGKAPGHKHDDDDGSEGAIFAEINITPLTDIFLVLLIIFMVASSVSVAKAREQARSGLTVNLPKGTRREIPERAQSMIVEIAPNGDILADGVPVKKENIRGLFLARFKNAPDTQVILRADRSVPHGTVVEVMEAAKDVGLRNLAIATRSAEP